MFRILIFTKFFGVGGGGHPEALLLMSKALRKKIIFDVYTSDGISQNIGDKGNLKSISRKKNKKLKIDSYNAFIICGSWQIKILLFLLIAKFKKRKIIYMPKGNLNRYEFYSYKVFYKLPILFTIEILKILLSDLIIYTSKLEKKYCFSSFFKFKKNTIIADYYTPIKKSVLRNISKKRGIYNFGFIAQYSKIKSLIECIDAFDMICNIYPKKKLFLNIAGTPKNNSSKYHNNVIKKIASSNYRKRIKVLGQVGGINKKIFYKKMNLILYPSKFESFGIIPFECIQYKCNILTSHFVGALENVKSKNIYKIKKITKNNITKGMRYFLKNSHKNRFKLTIEKFNFLILSNSKKLYCHLTSYKL